jgi:hypothetical protein
MSVDQFVKLCESLPMDDKIIQMDVREALDLCCGENAFSLDAVNQDNWLAHRNRFLDNVRHNGGRSHDAIMIVLYWFRQFLIEE